MPALPGEVNYQCYVIVGYTSGKDTIYVSSEPKGLFVKSAKSSANFGISTFKANIYKADGKTKLMSVKADMDYTKGAPWNAVNGAGNIFFLKKGGGPSVITSIAQVTGKTEWKGDVDNIPYTNYDSFVIVNISDIEKDPMAKDRT